MYGERPINTGRARRSTNRRNFGDEEVQATERRKLEELEADISFERKWGHYFSYKDIRKWRQLQKDDPSEFEKIISTDPEIRIRDQLAQDNRTTKSETLAKGRYQAQKLFSEYAEDHFEYDELGIQHFIPSDVSVIKNFNEVFEKDSSIYQQRKREIEDKTIDISENIIIPAERNRLDKAKEGIIKTDSIVGLSHDYAKAIRKSEKKLKKAETDDEIGARTAELTKVKLKKEVIDDILNYQQKPIEFGSPQWFDKNKNRLDEYNKKYDLDKYMHGKFIYRRRYDHFFVFICSGGGKTSLVSKYQRYLADFDQLLEYENNFEKFAYLMGYSKYYEKWDVANNYWKEMFLTYEYKFRNKIILLHSPAQLPDGALRDVNCGLIILPSVKRWDLREFKNNYNHLLEYETDITKVMLHYRYYFYIIYHYFKMATYNYEFEFD